MTSYSKMLDSKALGNLIELQCATRLYELGCKVSIPFGNSEKYDLIIDVNNKLYKVQCKTSKAYFDDDGNPAYIQFDTRWNSRNSSGCKHYSYQSEEVDYFATFFDNECYLVKFSECSTAKRLRIKETRNGQRIGVSFLEDYCASKILELM